MSQADIDWSWGEAGGHTLDADPTGVRFLREGVPQPGGREESGRQEEEAFESSHEGAFVVAVAVGDVESPQMDTDGDIGFSFARE